MVTFWEGRKDVDDWARSFAKPRLCFNFCYLEKANLQYWSSFVRNVRQTRAATGYAVTYQCVTQNDISSAKRLIAYAKWSFGRSLIKVPMGCYGEFPPVFTYKGSAMIDTHSGYWVVGYTKLVAIMVALILFDA